LHPARCADSSAQSSQDQHREYAMRTSSTDLTQCATRLQRFALPLRVLYLGRPGLLAKLLAIVAFFSIGIV